jgi:hypothetical protein
VLDVWEQGEELLITDLDLIASLPLTLQTVAAKEHAHDLNLAALVVPLDSFFLIRYRADTILSHFRLTCCKKASLSHSNTLDSPTLGSLDLSNSSR